MIHRTHPQQAVLVDEVSSRDAMDALLHDLGQTRARTRPQGRPFVTLAYAQSVDGSISIARGQRSRLSGPESLRFTHALRAGHDGILVGVGTVLTDDPELRVRLVDGPDPQPVIVDTHLRTPVEAKLLAQSGRQPWIGTTAAAIAGNGNGNGNADGNRNGATNEDGTVIRAGADVAASAAANDARDSDEGERRSRIEGRGARILGCEPHANGWVDLADLLRQLHAAGIQHLMVEGGARIITSFLEARLVDYVTVTIAPVFMGGLSAVGRMTRSPTATGGGMPGLRRWVSARLGHDLVISGEVAWPSD
jgi:riboflavin biosynthesis pyrimidine reductase